MEPNLETRTFETEHIMDTGSEKIVKGCIYETYYDPTRNMYITQLKHCWEKRTEKKQDTLDR